MTRRSRGKANGEVTSREFDRRTVMLAQEAFLRRFSRMELPRCSDPEHRGRSKPREVIDLDGVFEVVEQESIASLQAANAFLTAAEGWTEGGEEDGG